MSDKNGKTRIVIAVIGCVIVVFTPIARNIYSYAQLKGGYDESYRKINDHEQRVRVVEEDIYNIKTSLRYIGKDIESTKLAQKDMNKMQMMILNKLGEG